MKKQLWAMIVLASVAALSACSSTDSNGTGGATGGSTPVAYVPTPSDTFMGEDEACTQITDAMMAAAQKLQCALTQATCPGYIRSSQAPECSEWDIGSIQGCVDFYGTFTSCNDFANRPCQIRYRKDSAPNGCPVADAGTDSETDSATDATTDSQPDAGSDSDNDAATDAAVDAAEDTAADAAAE